VRSYSREELIQQVGVDVSFFLALESEDIVRCDAPEPDRYSERMLERVRVAHELVTELDVNLPGAAIIVRMREELVGLRRDLESLAVELQRLRGGARRAP